MNFQPKKPQGSGGRRVLQRMNKHHSGLTVWALGQLAIPQTGAILDVGCGGGRTIGRLLAASAAARVYGLDYSEESVWLARHANARAVDAGRALIRQGSVSHLPYAAGRFQLVTAVETHFFWPNLAGDVCEVLRVMAPGGRFALIAETYAGSHAALGRWVRHNGGRAGMTILTPDEHRKLLEEAGFVDVELHLDTENEWICAVGQKGASLA
jgi:SAM-dependent methyltransferase